jgi:hypothetical protein
MNPQFEPVFQKSLQHEEHCIGAYSLTCLALNVES